MLENAAPTSVYVEALDDQNKCMDRQNSLRPIFVNYFKVTLYHRVKAVTFRRVLADHGYDMEQLHEIWNDKKRVCFIYFVNNIFQQLCILKTHAAFNSLLSCAL